MNGKIFFGLALFFTLFVGSDLYAGVDMKEGKWEITSKTEMEGMPMGMPMGAKTITQCMTKENVIPKELKNSKGCKIIDSNVDGNTVTWTMECEDRGGKMTANGTITYKGETLEGTNIMNIQTPDGPMNMKHNMTGRWVGDCK